MMSTNNDEESSSDEVCDSCGIEYHLDDKIPSYSPRSDDVKLKWCWCNAVKYCSGECLENHWPQHLKLCKQRMADDLFEQPDDSHLGDCPICCLPLPLDAGKSTLMDCCCKVICKGCYYTHKKREREAGRDERCTFCREPEPKSKVAADKNVMNRIKKNDPVAMREMGVRRYCEGVYDTAFEYLSMSAGLGDAMAHYCLSIMYGNAEGVEKDKNKEYYHSVQAAMRGHPTARHNLGIMASNIGRYDSAAKHYIIAANLGLKESLKPIKELYADGHASKEDYADALRAYQAATDATKSQQREEAERSRG